MITRRGIELADLMIIHGDRHEIVGAALAANIMGVPIAHLGGGDVTEGSQDDCFRHAITKLAHLHFPSNQDSAPRIIQMGEDPAHVHAVGCPGIDAVLATPLLTRSATFAAVGFGLATPVRSLLVLLHPNTLGDTRVELEALSYALQTCPGGIGMNGSAVILVGPNADAGGDLIRAEWQLLSSWAKFHYHETLPSRIFLSLMRWCDVMVGNSSSGFYEAPCFGTPVVNIGDRQQGRPKPRSVTTVRADADEISKAIAANLAFAGFGKHLGVTNPYGDGHSAERIAKIIGAIDDPRALLRKTFRQAARTDDVLTQTLVFP